MKKIIVSIIVFFIVFIGIELYNSQKTVEAWWGVMYPTLSFIGFEDEEQNNTRVSALDTNYYYVEKEEPIKMKIAIVEWFKNTFGKE